MKIIYEQLDNYLQKNLAPLFCFYGEEILLMQEAITALRKVAEQQGYIERKKFFLESGFDWDAFLCEAKSFSLFSDKTLLELHCAEGKITAEARNALQIYCSDLPTNKVLLITFNKLDSKEHHANWAKTFDKNGIFLPIYPINGIKLTKWIVAQLKQAGFNTSEEGSQLLADLTEGNLLATRQAIEKLQLFFRRGEITAQDIAAVITDSSHFDIFDFVDALLLGEIKKLYHVYEHIKAEKIEYTIILWAIVREIRLLLELYHYQEQGLSMDQALEKCRIWQIKKPHYRQALKRLTKEKLFNLLQEASAMDQLIKGAAKGNLENKLWQFSLKIAGLG